MKKERNAPFTGISSTPPKKLTKGLRRQIEAVAAKSDQKPADVAAGYGVEWRNRARRK